VVGRYVVTPPSCPNWEKPPGYDFNNTEDSNLGCATTTNLGLMLANPGDLTRSRNMSPGDGTTQARAVKNFRDDKSAKAAASVSGSAAPGSASTAAGTESQTEGGGK
jgi:type IV pilus biogenesis protein CpaD/CtpE